MELFEVNMYGDFYGEETLMEHFGTFATEEEAIKLNEALDKMNYVGRFQASHCDNQYIEVRNIRLTDDDVDTVIAKYQAIIDKEDEKERAELAEAVAKAKEAIVLMNRIKEVFAPFDLHNNLTIGKFKEIAPALHKAIVDAKLGIHLFDRINDYNSDGTVEKWDGRERFNYFPIRVYCDTGKFENGLFYDYGMYDIDDDIRKHEQFVRENS